MTQWTAHPMSSRSDPLGLPPDRASRKSTRFRDTLGTAERWYRALAVLSGLFVLQTGLAPYDFLSSPVPDASRVLFATAVNRVTRPDIATNLFLYVPLGAFACLALASFGRRRANCVAISVACAAMLSLGVEWCQSYSPTRVSSLIDTVANVVGAAMGASLSFVIGPCLARCVRAARTELVLRPDGVVLKAYTMLLCLVAAAPFDLSFDVGHLRRAWKSAVAGLSSIEAPDVETVGDLGGVDEASRDAYRRWGVQKRWSRWAVEGVSFVVFARLAMMWLRREYGFGRAVSVVLCVWLGLSLSVGLGGLQLLVWSRGLNIVDVAARTVGLLVGLASWWCWKGGVLGATPSTEGRGSGLTVAVRWWSALTGLYILYTGLIPIGFDARHASEVLSWSTLIPFATFPAGRFDLIACDALEKVGMFALLASLLWTADRARKIAGSRRALSRAVQRCVGLAAVIEVAQIVIPPRTPSLTDVLLAAIGAVLGCAMSRWLAARWSEAVERRAELARRVGGEALPQRVFTPLEELIGSLCEPHPVAPHEPDARRAPAPKPNTP